MELALINTLRKLNQTIALIVGLGLLGMAAFVVADIALRQVHASFGGSEELAGYAMALVSSWGMAYALLELGHIRIDLIRSGHLIAGKHETVTVDHQFLFVPPRECTRPAAVIDCVQCLVKCWHFFFRWFHLKRANEPQCFIVRRPCECDRIGAPLAFDSHGDLVVMDAVEFPRVVFGDVFYQINRVKIIGLKIVFGQCHMLGLTLFGARVMAVPKR